MNEMMTRGQAITLRVLNFIFS